MHFTILNLQRSSGATKLHNSILLAYPCLLADPLCLKYPALRDNAFVMKCFP